MSITKIRSGLVKVFTDGAFFDATKVAFENVAFTPPPSAPWASVFFLPNQPSVATLGAGGQDQVTGVMQIDLNYPTNSGEADILAKFEAIKNAFTVGVRPIYQGQEVSIRSCGRSQGRVVGNFYRISITVMFYAQINR